MREQKADETKNSKFKKQKLETGNWKLAALFWAGFCAFAFEFLILNFALAASPDPLDRRARVAVVHGKTRIVMAAPAPDPQTFYDANQVFSKVFNGSNAINVAVVSPGSASTATGADQVLNASFNGSNALNVICLSGCGGSGGGMVYPGAGIGVSTGSAWGTSLTRPRRTLPLP